MIHFKFSDNDNRYIFLKPDNKTDIKHLQALEQHMNLVDPICYLPTYTGIPFTQDFLFKYTKQNGEIIWWCSIGLWQVCYKYFKDNDIPFNGLDSKRFKRTLPHSFEEFKAIVDSWGLKFPPRPYQYEAAYKVLQWNKSISVLSTRAGKTLIAYIVFRYCMEQLGAKKILMIVPSIQLVTQGFEDFKTYAEFFNTECIWGGGKEVQSSNLTIGTFQSLIKYIDKKDKKYDPHFFDGYDVVFVDETHRAKANQIKNIISQPFMKEVKIAFGMTGTLPKPKTIDFYCVHSLLGAKIQEIKAADLMEQGYISKIKINQCRLYYDNEILQRDLFIRCSEYALSDFVLEKNEKGKMKHVPLENPQFLIRDEKKLPFGIMQAKAAIYGDKHLDNNEKDWKYMEFLKETTKLSTKTNGLSIEHMMVHFMKARIEYICNIILPKCKYNTLILVQHTDYAEYLLDVISKNFPHKDVGMIIGKISPKKRDQIKNKLNESNNCILIANYSILSTGITLGNLCYGILAESYKSEILNIQSLGRGLGLSDLKDRYIVYDIIDCFNKDITGGPLYKQGTAKVKMYKEHSYPYEIIEKHLGDKIILEKKETRKKNIVKEDVDEMSLLFES